MLSSSDARLRIANILIKLAPEERISPQEKSDLDSVVDTIGEVDKVTRHRFHAYDLEDFFGPELSPEIRETLRSELIEASNNPGRPEPPALLPTTWIVSFVAYFILFGVKSDA